MEHWDSIPGEKKYFLLTTVSKYGSGARPFSYPMGRGVHSLGVKRQEREDYHSHPFSAHMSSWLGAQLSWGRIPNLPYFWLYRCILAVRNQTCKSIVRTCCLALPFRFQDLSNSNLSIRLLWQKFSVVPQPLQTNVRILSRIKASPLLSITFPIY